MNSILKFLPPQAIRAAGQLQFKFPFLQRFIRFLGSTLATEGVIPRGSGKGLYFNARGCNPGYLAGTSEPLEQSLVDKYSHPESVVYDLGANAGFYALIAARRVGPRGRVYAFEPAPLLAQRIRENATRNSLDNVHIVEAAVSAKDGRIQFGIAGGTSTENSILRADSENSLDIESVRLDSFCQSHPDPSLLMIDIEGAEIDALQGGLTMLARARPVIMVEVHWLGRKFTDFIEEFIEPLGYRATTYDGKPLDKEESRYHALILPV